MSNIITSNSNQKIKEILLLQEKASARKEKGLFVVEGVREINNCLLAGFNANSFFYSPDIINREIISSILKSHKTGENNLYEVSKNVYQKLAYRASTEGVIGIFHTRENKIDNLDLEKKNSLIIVVEGVEKPGNIGAIIRTADACGCSAILLCNCPTDLYNPNIIRSSLGGVFTQKIVSCSSKEAIKFLKDNKIKIYTAQLQDSKYYYNTDMTKGCAIVVGSEANGLTSIWREVSDERILIPMRGKIDSLNVSVSTAILCYEALRQRSISKD